MSLTLKKIIFIFSFLFISCNYISQNNIIKDNSFKNPEILQNQLEKNKILLNEENNSNSLKDRICTFNYVHICFSFLFLPVFSIILIIKDLRDDKNFSRLYSCSATDKAKEEFKSFKNTYITSGKYLFSWFLMKYNYPLTNIFLIYSYDHPRYIRFLISTIKIILNILLTSIILFQYLFDNNSAINFQNGLISFAIVIIISMIMHFFFQFTVNYLLEHDRIRKKIFKPKFENLRKYAYYFIKKDILFNSKWHLIRNRILSYYRICGPLILVKFKKKKSDKYERYARNKRMNFLSKLADNLNSFNSSLNSNEDDRNSFLDSGELKERLLPSVNNYNIKIKQNNKNENMTKSKNNISKNINNLCITKGAEPISLSRTGVNNMKLKTLKKIEDIRNRYINKNNTKYDETLDVDINYKTFDNLDIEALDNYTYISTDAMINKLNKINSNSDKMMVNFYINGTLSIILTLLNIALVLITLQAKENKDISDINEWLWILFIEIIVINFFIYLGISFFISIFISRFYGYKKRNCFYKMIFNVFIEKYIRYLFRIRLLLTKYQKEFNFIEI